MRVMKEGSSFSLVCRGALGVAAVELPQRFVIDRRRMARCCFINSQNSSISTLYIHLNHRQPPCTILLFAFDHILFRISSSLFGKNTKSRSFAKQTSITVLV
jgi:hypothetical protein